MDKFMDFFSGKLEYELDHNIRKLDSIESRFKAGKISKEEAKAELEAIKDRAYA